MISLIACADLNNAIGKNNKLLCHMKNDLEYFVEKTNGKYIVMGRNTWESIGCKPLKDRKNIVLSTTLDNDNPTIGGFVVIHDIQDVLRFNYRFPSNEIMIIGGQKVYEQFLPFANKVYLTRIQNEFEDADTYFPMLNDNEWELSEKSDLFKADEQNEYPYQFLTYTRK